MNCHHRRTSASLALLFGAGLVLTFGGASITYDHGLVSSASAQPLRKLIARLRGERLPAGITKAEGRIEANQVDVSSKYSGQLVEISVEEGTRVTAGQPIARLSSPEYQAQLRAAQADVQKSKDALAAAEAEIASRQSALEFAKSDFERGQQLMKTGFITKQEFEQRKRNYDAAVAAVQSFRSQRDQARSAINNADAEVERVQSIISDLTLVSPRNGLVQYQMARVGETIAVGQPVVTILDLTDVYMIVFLRAADSGRLGVGDEARVILEAAPDYVIPATISFVASDAQFTPKTVETKDERAKLMFRVQLRIDPKLLEKYYGKVEPGLRGAGFVRSTPNANWPTELQIKLPPAPVPGAPAAEAAAASPVASTPTPTPTPAPAAEPAAPPPVEQAPSVEVSAEAPKTAQAPASAPVTEAPVAAPSPETPAPATVAQAPSSSPATEAPSAPAPAPQGSASEPTAPPVAEEPASVLPTQDATAEFAPETLAQLSGAWANSAAECDRLFRRQGKALIYRQPVDRFARAAIIEPQRIRLPFVTCRLQSASQQGGALVLDGECQDSISYTSRTLHIKLRSDTELVYSPTGDSALETALMKCPL